MHLNQKRWNRERGWRTVHDGLQSAADLVFVFGNRAQMESPNCFESVRAAHPAASIVGGSTGGEIQNARVLDGTVVATAIEFEETEVRTASVRHEEGGDSRATGGKIGTALDAPSLAHVFLLSDGLQVNGSELVRGLVQSVPDGVMITGGLAADQNRFERTPLWHDEIRKPPSVVGVGFYGDQLSIGYGSHGGWDPFGPRRRIRRSEGNVLYAFDNHSALELYKRYLGPYAEDLPASGLRFPLAVEVPEEDHEIVRSVIGVNEEENSVTFAGNVPEGAYARLMKVNNERLIDGAIGAAQDSRDQMDAPETDVAILVSCVGRKRILQQRTEEEVEHVRKKLGQEIPVIGFYSYGEIAPVEDTPQCDLHNQTMTVTTLSE
jgi:hypothetical protein